jgi:hypothetical protein
MVGKNATIRDLARGLLKKRKPLGNKNRKGKLHQQAS